MKPKYLFIAEKPSLRKTIQEIYNKYEHELPYEAIFTNTAGHCVRLALPREYKDVQENGFIIPWIPQKYELRIIEETENLYKKIKETYKSNKFDFVVNACDPEREGQYIFHLIRTHINIKEPAKRFWTNDLTESSVKHALKNLKDNDAGYGLIPGEKSLRQLTEASILRGQSDFLVGMNFSSALNVPVGRVRTAVLNMVVQRDLEIENYVEKIDYELSSLYKDGFCALLLEEKEKKRFSTREDALLFANKNLKPSSIVKSYETKQEKQKPASLYNLSQLQADAGKKMGINADKVLKLCQSLYEKGYLSYPRTSCKYISIEILMQTKEILQSISCISELQPFLKNEVQLNNIERLKNDKSYVNNEALAEEGHTALIPTLNYPNINNMDNDEIELYKIVATRFLAIFLEPKITETTTIILENNGYMFEAKKTSTIDEGFNKLYGKEIKSEEKLLPHLNSGEEVFIVKNEAVEKKSSCPSYFTDGSLILAMENPTKYLDGNSYKKILKETHGIGTDATRSATISKLIMQKQLERKKGKGKQEYIISTSEGRQIIKALQELDITKVEMTGKWEQKLEDVANGKLTFKQYEKEMIEYVEAETQKYKEIKLDLSCTDYSSKILFDCPFCKEKQKVTKGKYGYYCSNGSMCKFSITFENIKWLKEKWKITLTEKAIEQIIRNGKIKTKSGITVGIKKNDKGYMSWNIKKSS